MPSDAHWTDAPACVKALLAACCGGGSGFDCSALVITDPFNRLCVTLAADCPLLDGLAMTTGSDIGPAPCSRRLFSAPIACPSTLEEVVSGEVLCAPEPTTGTACDGLTPGQGVVRVAGTSWTLWREDAPGGSIDLPVTWVSASPPIGVATGYLYHDASPDETCPCPDGTRVDLLITEGPCP